MAKIRIAGTIIPNSDKWIYDWFEMDSFCLNDLTKALSSDHEDVELEINSPGGSVFAGSEIYTKLMGHQGKVTANIVGLAASAASVIAMAGDTVRMSPTAQMMIHNVSAQSAGDYRDMEHTAMILKQANETVANAYEIKTGKAKEELLALMDSETWFTPEQAKDQGFIDEIMFVDNSDFGLVASFAANIIPPQIIQNMNLQKQQAELDLLKLKGEIKE